MTHLFQPENMPSKPDRPTIALLTDTMYHVYPSKVFRAAAQTAQEFDLNLLCVVGGVINPPNTPRLPGTVLYTLVGKHNVSGVIAITGLLGTYMSDEELLAFCHQYFPLPVVSIGIDVPKCPSILVENATGMQVAVEHLIKAHGCRKIASIRGPEGNQEANERYDAYKRALAAHNIPFDPNLVVTGNFLRPSGAAGVATLLDERRLAVDAVVTANDWMAFGASEALRTRGLNIPQDIKIIGFDDADDSRSSNPPLTTVRQPFGELGAQAVRTMQAMLHGEPVAESIRIPTELIVRQSCGCPFAEVLQAQIPPSIRTSPGSGLPLLQLQQADILHELRHVIEGQLEDFEPQWLDHLWQGLFTELERSAPVFLQELQDILQACSSSGDLTAWQSIISVLRRYTLAAIPDTETRLKAEALWQQARVMVGEMIRLQRENRGLQQRQQAQLFRQIGARLITTFALSELIDALAEGLPQLNFSSCALMLYETRSIHKNERDPAPEGSVIRLAYSDEQRRELPQNGLRMPSRQIVPHAFWPSERASSFVLLPLYFQQEQTGFILLEDCGQDEIMYNALRAEISSALQGALLMEQIRQNAYELAAANEEIRILNEHLKEENMRMSAELDISRRIQQMMLPTVEELQGIEGLDIVGSMQPAEEVGGDYYDVLKNGHGVHIGIGDVTGHGLESGLIMLMTQTAARTLIEHGETDAVTFLDTLNRTLYKNIQRMKADRSLTLAFIKYEHGQLKIIGQHEEILVIRQSGEVERISTMELGFPLGLERDIRSFVAEASITLQAGESVVLYTDGVTEAENEAGELYGLEHLCHILSNHATCTAEEIKNAVLQDLAEYIGKQTIYDDVTLVILQQRERPGLSLTSTK